MTFPHFRAVITALLLAGFFFIAPLPHTAALRNLFLFGLLVLLMVIWKKESTTIGASVVYNAEILVLGALTLWMIVQTAIWAVDRPTSFDDFFREWVGGGLLAAGIGYGIAKNLQNPNGTFSADNLPTWIVLPLFIHAAWTLFYQTNLWIQTGQYPMSSTPYGDYAVLSNAVSIAIALLAADFAVRWTVDGKLFPWSKGITQALLLIASVAIVTIRARNGVLTVFSVFVLLALLLAWREGMHGRIRRITLSLILILVVMAGSLVAMNIGTDSRWRTFGESAISALDTQKNKRWLDASIPTMSASGLPMEESAHLRVAWAKVAVEGIISRPQGFGYGLGGFGRYIEAEYGKKDFVSSHSGLLDFTLANGVVGLVLFLTFCSFLFRRGWLAWVAGNPWGLALMLTLTNYFVRILLDGHFGSFRLKMVALLLGVLYWLTIRPTINKETVSVDL